MYDQRERHQLIYEWSLAAAERVGVEKGKLAGDVRLIQTLQELLGDEPMESETLRRLGTASLQSLETELRERLRQRS